MTRCDIPWGDNYIGDWAGEPSRELRIRKVDHRRFLATLLINGCPIKRPWMNDQLTVDMPATLLIHRIGRIRFLNRPLDKPTLRDKP
jgi:hypothetical protein